MLDNVIVAVIISARRRRYLQFICDKEKFICDNIIL